MSYFYEAMNEVLTRRHYDVLTGRAVDHRQIITEAIGRAVVSLLEQLQLHMPEYTGYNADTLIIIFAGASALLLFGITVRAIYIILKRRGKKIKTSSDVSAIFDDIENKKFSLTELLQISHKLAESNQFRDAVRLKYIAVLVSLDGKHIIHVKKSKTNAQLARELSAAAPHLFDPFTSIIGVFHEAWFGLKNTDKDSYARFAFNAEELLNAEK